MRDLKFLTVETKKGKVVPGRWKWKWVMLVVATVGSFGAFSVASPSLPIWMLGNVFPHISTEYISLKGIPCAGGGWSGPVLDGLWWRVIQDGSRASTQHTNAKNMSQSRSKKRQELLTRKNETTKNRTMNQLWTTQPLDGCMAFTPSFGTHWKHTPAFFFLLPQWMAREVELATWRRDGEVPVASF